MNVACFVQMFLSYWKAWRMYYHDLALSTNTTYNQNIILICLITCSFDILFNLLPLGYTQFDWQCSCLQYAFQIPLRCLWYTCQMQSNTLQFAFNIQSDVPSVHRLIFHESTFDISVTWLWKYLRYTFKIPSTYIPEYTMIYV